jgi:GT2 family glycosyltransferase
MAQAADSSSCDLSVVITIVSGAAHLAECLAALERQVGCDQLTLEIIVPHDRYSTDIPALQQRFPDTVFYPVTLTVDGPAGLCHEHFDALRTAGLQLASGQIIAMLEDHEQADVHWCRRMIETHQLPHAAVGGAVENGVDRPLNWATWFLDFGRYQNPLTEGPSTFLTDVNIAYKKPALETVRPAWEHGFSEPAVHSALLARGETLWLSPDIIVYQHRTGLTLSHAMRERFVWGRFFAGNRLQDKGLGRRLAYSAASVAVPGIILLKKIRDVRSKGRLQGAFVKALPMIMLLAICWASGECIGYLTGKPSNYQA